MAGPVGPGLLMLRPVPLSLAGHPAWRNSFKPQSSECEPQCAHCEAVLKLHAHQIKEGTRFRKLLCPRCARTYRCGKWRCVDCGGLFAASRAVSACLSV
eukprot:11698525-Alexandrium_andersonii.AAC.1